MLESRPQERSFLVLKSGAFSSSRAELSRPQERSFLVLKSGAFRVEKGLNFGGNVTSTD